MNEYEEHLAEDRRLVILRLLNEVSGHQANESVLETSLAALGHVVSRKKVRNDIRYLIDHGCVTDSWFGGKVQVVKLSRRGQDVATGKDFVEGIKKPSID